MDQKLLETEFSIAICRQSGDKCQSKILFLAIYDPRSSIVESVLYCRLFSVCMMVLTLDYQVVRVSDSDCEFFQRAYI